MLFRTTKQERQALTVLLILFCLGLIGLLIF